jgi:hypothetical protein
MKMHVGYEEKTFEMYFNIALEKSGDVCFPFGQVQEGIIGADAAVLTRRQELIALLGLIPSAIKNGEDISEMCKTAENLACKYINSDLPPMCANILFQYKRPVYMSRGRGKERKQWDYRPIIVIELTYQKDS